MVGSITIHAVGVNIGLAYGVVMQKQSSVLGSPANQTILLLWSALFFSVRVEVTNDAQTLTDTHAHAHSLYNKWTVTPLSPIKNVNICTAHTQSHSKAHASSNSVT